MRILRSVLIASVLVQPASAVSTSPSAKARLRPEVLATDQRIGVDGFGVAVQLAEGMHLRLPSAGVLI
jgi:hypothetical protein